MRCDSLPPFSARSLKPSPPPPLTPLSAPCSRFQYILGAATSVAMKMNEESLTYLNQGQSYEIKVKKLGDITG